MFVNELYERVQQIDGCNIYTGCTVETFFYVICIFIESLKSLALVCLHYNELMVLVQKHISVIKWLSF